MRALFEGPTPYIILAVVVLLFGATRLPALSKSIGQSVKIFRKEMKPEDEAKPDADSAKTNVDTAKAGESSTDKS